MCFEGGRETAQSYRRAAFKRAGVGRPQDGGTAGGTTVREQARLWSQGHRLLTSCLFITYLFWKPLVTSELFNSRTNINF